MLILGMEGVGKSTLLNFLEGIPMKIELLTMECEGEGLPGIDIKHGSNKSGLLPGIYSPAGKDFTYIEFTGFRDRLSVDKPDFDIAFPLLRSKILRKAKYLKFLLMIPIGSNEYIQTSYYFLNLFLNVNYQERQKPEFLDAIAIVGKGDKRLCLCWEDLKERLAKRTEELNKYLKRQDLWADKIVDCKKDLEWLEVTIAKGKSFGSMYHQGHRIAKFSFNSFVSDKERAQERENILRLIEDQTNFISSSSIKIADDELMKKARLIAYFGAQ